MSESGLASERPSSATTLLIDPFRERWHAPLLRTRLLGGRFEFETDEPELRRLVEWAYGRLPQHRSGPRAPRLRVRLRVQEQAARGSRDDAPPVELLSGGGLLAAAVPRASFVAMAPDCHSAIINVARDLLRFPYNVRYELIELAVYTLAARVLGLVPLHAGCVGLADRGLLVVGESGAGKSTLTLQCALAGLELLAEDSVLVAPRTLHATGVPNFAHLCRDALRFLPPALAAALRRSPTIRRRSGVRKLEIDLRGSRFRLAEPPLRLVGTVFLSAQRAGNGPILVPLTEREAAARLRASQPYGASQPGWREFSGRMARRPAFELRRARHPAEAARTLQTWLAGRSVRIPGEWLA